MEKTRTAVFFVCFLIVVVIPIHIVYAEEGMTDEQLWRWVQQEFGTMGESSPTLDSQPGGGLPAAPLGSGPEEPDYNMVGDSGVKEDGYSRLVVTPLNEVEPIKHFKQKFEYKSKQAWDKLWLAYVYDDVDGIDPPLVEANVEYLKPAEFDWVEHEFTCEGEFGYQLNKFPGERNPHFAWCAGTCRDFEEAPEYDCNAFEGAFKQGNLPTATVLYDRWEQTATAQRIPVTQNFAHYKVPDDKPQFAGKHIFPYTQGFSMAAGETKTWEIEYKPVEDAGKWDLVIWTGDEWNCILDKSCDYSMVFDPTWMVGDWNYRKLITIESDNIGSDLTDYPMHLNIDDDSDLIANALHDGNDLRFTSYDGNGLLSFEKEAYSVNGADLNAHFWIKVPTVHSAFDTNIWMYYGNFSVGAADGQDTENVWNSNYVFVMHMKESAWTGVTDDVLESTSNDNNGTSIGSSASVFDGKIGRGGEFNGSTDGIEVLDSSSLVFTSTTQKITLSAWLNPDSIADRRTILSKYIDSTNKEIFFEMNGADLRCFAYENLTSGDYTALRYETGAIMSTNNWQYAAVTIDIGTDSMQFYRNGGAVTTTAATGSKAITNIPNSTSHLDVGHLDRTYFFFDGTFDEARIAKVSHSADWIQADYNFVVHQASMVSFGSEEVSNIAPDLNIWQVENNDLNAALPSFSYAADGNLTFRFIAVDLDGDDLNFNMWYDTSANGKTNHIISDVNLSTDTSQGSCDTNAKSGMVCTWDWNISGIADANYWVTMEVNDGTDSNTATTARSFRVNPAADSCSCPDSGHWRIANGDACTLSTLCNLSAGNLHIVSGSLTIASGGTLSIPPGYGITGENASGNALEVLSGGQIIARD